MTLSGLSTQTWGKLATVDVILICIYLALCLYVGWKNVGKIKNIKDYALGTEKISTAALVATLYATHLGAGATIGTIERIAEIGVLFAIVALLNPIMWAVTLFVYRGIEQFRGCITASDIMHRLYGAPGRVVMNICILINSTATVAAQTAALGYLMHYFLDIPVAVGIVVGAGTLIIYSVMGGIRAVVVTDMFQFALFYVVLPVLCGVFIHQSGGWHVVLNLIPAEKMRLSWHNREQMWIFIGAVVYLFTPLNSSPFIQRFLMSMDKRQLTKALSITAVLDFTVVLTICLFGFVTLAASKGIVEPHDILWHVIDSKLWGLLKGIFVISILAVIMSTADSYLNNTGVLIARDMIKSSYPHLTDKAEVLIARAASVLAGIGAIVMVVAVPRILDLIWVAVNFYDPVVLIPMAAGCLKFRTNTTSYIWAVILGITGTLLGSILQGKLDVLSNIMGIIGSAVGLFGAHYAQKILGNLSNVAIQEQLALAKWREEEAWRLGVSVEALDIELQQRAQEEIARLSRRKSLLAELFARIKWLAGLRFHDVVAYSQRSVAKYEPRYYEFAIFGLSFCIYPLLFLDSTYELYPKADQHPLWLIEMALRISVGFGCIALGLQHLWGEETKAKYLPLYFHFMLTCALPGLSTYAYLVSPANDGILAGVILAIFSLALLVDWLSFTIIVFSGFILGNLCYIFFSYLTGSFAMYQGAIGGSLLYVFLAGIMAWLMRFIQEQHVTKISRLAITDALTGLYNRHYMDARLNILLQDAQTRDRNLSLVMIDIDHFKMINDTYGHETGNAVLHQLARHVKENARPVDECMRYGGEEFMIAMPNTSLKQATLIAERLRQVIAETHFTIPVPPGNLTCTVSLGVASFRKGETLYSLIARTDDALYTAKETGRNKVGISSKLVRTTYENAISLEEKDEGDVVLGIHPPANQT